MSADTTEEFKVPADLLNSVLPREVPCYLGVHSEPRLCTGSPPVCPECAGHVKRMRPIGGGR